MSRPITGRLTKEQIADLTARLPLADVAYQVKVAEELGAKAEAEAAAKAEAEAEEKTTSAKK